MLLELGGHLWYHNKRNAQRRLPPGARKKKFR